jgi:hypothetical protein
MEFDNMPSMGYSKPSLENDAIWLKQDKDLFESKIEDLKQSLDVV